MLARVVPILSRIQTKVVVRSICRLQAWGGTASRGGGVVGADWGGWGRGVGVIKENIARFARFD